MDHLDAQFDSNDGTSFDAIFQRQQQQEEEEREAREERRRQLHLNTSATPTSNTVASSSSSLSSPPPSSTSPTSAFRSSPSSLPSNDKQLSATTTSGDSPSPSFVTQQPAQAAAAASSSTTATGLGAADTRAAGVAIDERLASKVNSDSLKASSEGNRSAAMFGAASDMPTMLSVDSSGMVGGQEQSHQIHPVPRHASIDAASMTPNSGSRGMPGMGMGVGMAMGSGDTGAVAGGSKPGSSSRQLSALSSTTTASNPASPSLPASSSANNAAAAAAAAASSDFFNATLHSSPSPHRGSPLGVYGSTAMNGIANSPEDLHRQSPSSSAATTSQVKAETNASPFLSPVSTQPQQTPMMNRRLPERSDSYQSLSGEMSGMNMRSNSFSGDQGQGTPSQQSMRGPSMTNFGYNNNASYLGGMTDPNYGMSDYTMMSMDSPHSMTQGGSSNRGGDLSSLDNKRSNSDSGAGNGNNNADNGQGAASTKFVHKLFRMVSDPEYQHLISWNASGSSVVVTNFDEFAKEVLGKHFKHSNFSSFIRQLNMYGFYKVNKTPRGHRHAVDTQIWEFSHPKFLRGRPELLDDIRRKALDSEHARVEARDLQYSVSVGHMQLRQVVDEQQYRIEELYEVNMALRQVVIGLRDNVVGILDWIKMNNGGQLPFDAKLQHAMPPTPMIPSFSGMGPQGASQGWGAIDPSSSSQTADGPPIFVTEPAYGNVPVPGGVIGQGGPGGGDVFSFGAMSQVSPMGSRRVSTGSAQSEAMQQPQHHSPLLDEQGRPFSAHSSNAGRPSFGDGTMGAGRAIAGSNKAANSGLAIDTSLHQHAQFGIMPQGSNLSPNPGLGVIEAGGLSRGSISPQNAAMMAAAINTPLPPSPAVNAHINGNPLLTGQFQSMDHMQQGSPFMHTPTGSGMPSPSLPGGFPNHFGASPYAMAGSGAGIGAGDVFSSSAMANEEDDGMLGPNSKASRTPLKRTASNSGGQSGQQHLQQTPQQQAAATSTNPKRKSPS